MPIAATALHILHSTFGYEGFRGLQAEVIDHIARRHARRRRYARLSLSRPTSATAIANGSGVIARPTSSVEAIPTALRRPLPSMSSAPTGSPTMTSERISASRARAPGTSSAAATGRRTASFPTVSARWSPASRSYCARRTRSGHFSMCSTPCLAICSLPRPWRASRVDFPEVGTLALTAALGARSAKSRMALQGIGRAPSSRLASIARRRAKRTC